MHCFLVVSAHHFFILAIIASSFSSVYSRTKCVSLEAQYPQNVSSYAHSRSDISPSCPELEAVERFLDDGAGEFEVFGCAFDLRWYKMLGELSGYRKEDGDSLVPMEDDINQKLGTWIDTQRQQYKYFKNKEKSSRTPERIELLEKEGMVW